MSYITLHNTVFANKDAQGIEAANDSLHSSSSLELQDERVRQIIESPTFYEFDVWVKQYLEGNFSGDKEQIKRGENLAAERAELFKELIRLAPKTALEYANSDATKNQLPDSIAQHLERRISAYGDLMVYVVDKIDRSTGKMAGGDKKLEVVIGEARYKAFVYGRREAMTTKLQIPLQGVVLDGIMAVNENLARKLEATEYESRGVDLSEIGENGTAVEIGGKIVYFSNQSELENFVREQIEWEGKIGPVRSTENLKPDALNSSWTEGPKTLLFIRVDFPDRPGEPVDSQTGLPLTVQRAQDLMSEVNTFYINNSYGKTSIQSVTVTPVIRLPKPTSYYMIPETHGNYTEMMIDARNGARAAGYETNNYNLDIVASVNTGIGDAGLGNVGLKGSWLIGYFNLGVAAHELGHNYGLLHANLWRTNDGTVIGQGSNEEGEDPFDGTGCCGSPIAHFNTQYKKQLNWLTDANVQAITRDGVYRIYAQDSSTPVGIRTLKIRKDAIKTYWIEFRQLFTSNQNAMNGAIIRWDTSRGLNSGATQLLDMTPNTSTNATDAPLLIGQSFSDDVNRIKITILGKGNTVPESLDVRIELNVGCSFSLGQTSQNFLPDGGGDNIMINTQVGCRPPATTNDDWLSATSTDNGTVSYIVAANYSSQSRTGTITIAGQVFTVQQGAAITVCVAPPSGMVAWWRGEGNALDQTRINNGTLSGNMIFGGGKVGGGFLGNADGSGITEVPDSPSLALTRSMTFEGWLKVDSYGGKVIEKIPIDGSIGHSYEIGISSGGSLSFVVWYTNNIGTGIGTNSLPLGQFVHFAASLDDETGQIKMYINGSLVRQFTITQRPNNLLEAKISIGRINGITDELSVYNRALSASEIRAIYNAGTAATGAIGKCLSAQPQRKPFDFDGDGKADISVFRPSTGIWYLNNSTAGFSGAQFGVGGDKIVPADFDGDGKTDIAVYRNGTWFLQRSQLGFTGVSFGDANDIPVPADYDGDGKSEVVVFRPSTNTWYSLNLVGNQVTTVSFGVNGDKPVPADYDGDGKADIAVFRPSNNTWYTSINPANNYGAIIFGDANDRLVPADYDGDGKADIAVFRPSNGNWYLRQSTAGLTGVAFGISTDLPAPADYDGDGRTDVAVFRNGTWYIERSAYGFTGVSFGASSDKPIPNAFVP